MRIRDAHLLDGSKCSFESFNVFVGGNARGKTTFFMELYEKLTGLQHRAKYSWIDHATH